MRGGGHSDVPKGLDRPTFFLLMDGLDRRHHALAEAVGEELVEVGVDVLVARVFDRLDHRLGARPRVFPQDGRDLVEPPVRSAFGVADTDFGVLVCAPDDPVAADVVEEEEAGAKAGFTNFAVPHEEAPREAARAACAAAWELDAVLFVGEEHEHVTIARKQRRVVLGDRHLLAKFTWYAPLAVNP